MAASMPQQSEPRAEAYRDAAAERCSNAMALLNAGHFAGAIWVAGVALEALFRAYHRRTSDRLDTGHDLKQLYKAARFERHIRIDHVPRISVAISLVAANWKHRYRYDSSAAVERALVLRTPAELRRRAIEVANAAQEVVNYGVSRWNSRT